MPSDLVIPPSMCAGLQPEHGHSKRLGSSTMSLSPFVVIKYLVSLLYAVAMRQQT